MMNSHSALLTAQLEAVLVQTDAPEVVLFRDAVGTGYLGMLNTVAVDGFHYLAVKVSTKRITELRAGLLDLRSALREPELPGAFHARLGAESASLDPIDQVPEAWYPDPDFLLSRLEDPAVADSEVLEDAVAQHAPVIVCSLNPPEAQGRTPRVNADRLGACLTRFQGLVRQSAKKLVREKAVPSNLKSGFGRVQVFAFSPGSFRVHLVGEEGADLFGRSLVGYAMERVDELVGLLDLPADLAIEKIRDNRGHLISSYHALMKFVVDSGVDLSYTWVDPGQTHPVNLKITTAAASAMCAVLDSKKELSEEAKTLSGVFTTVNNTTAPFSWILRDDEGNTHRGLVHEDAQDVLNGVVIESQKYALSCRERLMEKSSGKVSPQLFLLSIE